MENMENVIVMDVERMLDDVYALAALQGALGSGPRREEVLGPDRREALKEVMNGALTAIVMDMARYVADCGEADAAGMMSLSLREVPEGDGSLAVARKLLERAVVMKTLEWAYAEIDPSLADRWGREAAAAGKALRRTLDSPGWEEALLQPHWM